MNKWIVLLAWMWFFQASVAYVNPSPEASLQEVGPFVSFERCEEMRQILSRALKSQECYRKYSDRW